MVARRIAKVLRGENKVRSRNTGTDEAQRTTCPTLIHRGLLAWSAPVVCQHLAG